MELNINNHINDLLHYHDCVVVSGFGAFILNKKAASIEPTGKINPPKKIISFNSKIMQNDGLLANHIAKKENISYEEACLKIAHFSKKMIFKLKNDEKVTLEHLGEFYFSAKKIIFSPNEKSNYDKKSFGLKSFYFPKKKKKIYKLYSQELRIASILIVFIGLSFFFFSKYNISKNTNLSNVYQVSNQKTKPNNQKIIKDTLFEKTGLYNLQVSQVDYDLYNISGTNYHITTKKCFKIGFGINAQIKIYDQGKKRKREICFSSISGEDYTDCYNIKNVYKKVETSSDKLVVVDKRGRMRTAVLVFEETILDYKTLLNSDPSNSIEVDATDLTSRFINAVNSLSENNTTEINEVTFEPIEEITITPNENKNGDFLIVVGSFSTKQNAQKLVNELIKKGFKTASLAGKSSTNLFRVSCCSYYNEKDAKKELSNLKLEFKGAWVLNINE